MIRRIASFIYGHIIGITMITGVLIAWWGITHPNGLKMALVGVAILSVGLMGRKENEDKDENESDESSSSDSSDSSDPGSVEEGWLELFGKMFRKILG